VLNILRGSGPGLVGFLIWGGYDRDSLIEWTVEIDILQFAGLAMMFWGILVRFNIQKKVFILFPILLSFGLLNYLLTPIKSESIDIAWLTGLFWGSIEMSYFPFLTWIFYPIAGYLFGLVIIRINNKNKFYLNEFHINTYQFF